MFNIIYDIANQNKIMYITSAINNENYKTNYAVLPVQELPKYDVLRQELKIENNQLVVVNKNLTAEQLQEVEKIELNQLRAQREEECFPVINRGQLWYNKLTQEQIVQLNTWYQAWLDVTTTKIIPTKPSWLV